MVRNKKKTKTKSGSLEVEITGSSSSRTTAEEVRSGRTELSLQIQYSNSSFFPHKTNPFRLHWTLARCSQGQERDPLLQSVHIINSLINNAEVRKFCNFFFFSKKHTEVIFWRRLEQALFMFIHRGGSYSWRWLTDTTLWRSDSLIEIQIRFGSF